MDVTPTRRHNEHTFVMLTLKFNKKQISKVVMVFTTHICVVGLLRVKMYFIDSLFVLYSASNRRTLSCVRRYSSTNKDVNTENASLY